MFKARFRPSADSLITQIRNKIQEWKGAKIAARITVPPELQWWYWQEFGTAVGGRSGQTDPTGGASGHKYPIRPVNTTMLAWTGPDGKQVLVPEVKEHPGVPSHHFVTRTLPDNLEIAAIKLIAAMDRSAWSVKTVRDSLLGETMPRVKENIVQMIELTLPGINPGGKLKGQAAADVFDQESKIVDSSNG